MYDVAFRKKKLLNLDLRKSNLKIKNVKLTPNKNTCQPKLHKLCRYYELGHSQAMRTEISFQNVNEKEKKKIFGSISPQKL